MQPCNKTPEQPMPCNDENAPPATFMKKEGAEDSLDKPLKNLASPDIDGTVVAKRKSLEPLSTNEVHLRESQTTSAPLIPRDLSLKERNSVSPVVADHDATSTSKRRNSKLPRRISGDKAKFQQTNFVPLLVSERKSILKSPVAAYVKSVPTEPERGVPVEDIATGPQIIVNLRDDFKDEFLVNPVLSVSMVVFAVLVLLCYFLEVSTRVTVAPFSPLVVSQTFMNSSESLIMPMEQPFSYVYVPEVSQEEYVNLGIASLESEYVNFVDAPIIIVAEEPAVVEEVVKIEELEDAFIVTEKGLDEYAVVEEEEPLEEVLAEVEEEVLVELTYAVIDTETEAMIDAFIPHYTLGALNAETVADIRALIASFFDFLTHAAVSSVYQVPEDVSEMSFYIETFCKELGATELDDSIRIDALLETFTQYIVSPPEPIAVEDIIEVIQEELAAPIPEDIAIAEPVDILPVVTSSSAEEVSAVESLSLDMNDLIETFIASMKVVDVAQLVLTFSEVHDVYCNVALDALVDGFNSLAAHVGSMDALEMAFVGYEAFIILGLIGFVVTLSSLFIIANLADAIVVLPPVVETIVEQVQHADTSKPVSDELPSKLVSKLLAPAVATAVEEQVAPAVQASTIKRPSRLAKRVSSSARSVKLDEAPVKNLPAPSIALRSSTRIKRAPLL